MTFKIVCSVQDNQVTITLPPDFSDRKEVTVIVEDAADDRAKKFELMKQAAQDPLFLDDIREIREDFDLIDEEIE